MTQERYITSQIFRSLRASHCKRNRIIPIAKNISTDLLNSSKSQNEIKIYWKVAKLILDFQDKMIRFRHNQFQNIINLN